MVIVGLILIGVGGFLAGRRWAKVRPFGPQELPPGSWVEVVAGYALVAGGIGLLVAFV